MVFEKKVTVLDFIKGAISVVSTPSAVAITILCAQKKCNEKK
jgi:hypothetical protein